MEAPEGRRRLLVFVVAYYAETTLRSVLERIPPPVFETYDCEVLVVDDGSQDRTYVIGQEYHRAHPEIRMTVLRNEFNQGYGGNQKIGYQFAIREGFDFVAMVHGDGQYAPEELPRLLAPLQRGEADVVLGSRMLTALGALKGGMPIYKLVGNRILTCVQNTLLGTSLSEFHSGYRIYSVRMLAKLPFRLNTNDFHFDTEIIIQHLNAGARILELPIPTHYGDEISRVEGLKYAKNVVKATIKNLLHRAGLLYQRRYDTPGGSNDPYDLKLGYASSHTYGIEAVPKGSRVAVLGDGSCGVAAELVKKGCEVTLIARRPPSSPPEGVQVVVHDLDEPLAVDLSGVDVLLLLDVIEHLRSPEDFLDRLRAQFDYRPRTLILTTANVAFLVPRLMLLLGQFNYGRAGILDRTHTRLFYFRSARQLLLDAGFRIDELRGVPAPFPKALGEGWLGRLALRLNLLLILMSRTLFSYQIFVRATSTPDADFVLRDAKERSASFAEAPNPGGSGSGPASCKET